jgi:hypothetical protein
MGLLPPNRVGLRPERVAKRVAKTRRLPFTAPGKSQPMKKLIVGIVGCGWAAEAHLGAINATSNAQVTTICSARPLDPAALSAKPGCPLKVVGRLEDLWADRSVDVVCVCFETRWATQPKHPVFRKYEDPSTTVTTLEFKSGRVGKVASVIDCW